MIHAFLPGITRGLLRNPPPFVQGEIQMQENQSLKGE